MTAKKINFYYDRLIFYVLLPVIAFFLYRTVEKIDNIESSVNCINSIVIENQTKIKVYELAKQNIGLWENSNQNSRKSSYNWERERRFIQ